jgi:hypothetical protein
MFRFVVSTSLLALIEFGLSASPVLAHDARAFSFPDVAYYSPADAAQAADAFIQRELPAGISLLSAEEKLRAVNMGCADGAGQGSEVCRFYTLEGGDGGTLGEVWWRMHLEVGPDGRLAGAHFEQSRIGMTP